MGTKPTAAAGRELQFKINENLPPFLAACLTRLALVAGEDRAANSLQYILLKNRTRTRSPSGTWCLPPVNGGKRNKITTYEIAKLNSNIDKLDSCIKNDSIYQFNY